MSCFVLSWFGLLPVVGIPMAIMALYFSRAAMAEAQHEWNPAGRYRAVGAVLAIIGLFISFLFTVGIILAVLSKSQED